jgi:hypothetical protein
MFRDDWRGCAHEQSAAALVLRGRAIRTFASPALILTASLLFLGAYLIADEFRNPLASQSIGLFAAAFVLATAMTLLADLTQLFRGSLRNPSEDIPGLMAQANRSVCVQERATYKAAEHRTDLPYQRSYIDRVRVRA